MDILQIDSILGWVFFVIVIILAIWVCIKIAKIITGLIQLVSMVFEVPDLLSFEFLTLEECTLRIKEKGNDRIKEFFNTEKNDIHFAVFLNTLANSNLIEKRVDTYTREELEARRWIFDKLPASYQKRFKFFLKHGMSPIEKIKEQSEEIDRIFRESTAPQEDRMEIGTIVDIIREINHDKDLLISDVTISMIDEDDEIANQIKVIYFRRKPSGKKPPRKKILEVFRKYSRFPA